MKVFGIVINKYELEKAYGMAGLRQGYAIAHADTIKKMRPWVGAGGTGSLNVFGMAAEWAPISGPDFSVAVNLSPHQLIDPGLLDIVRSAMNEGRDVSARAAVSTKAQPCACIRPGTSRS